MRPLSRSTLASMALIFLGAALPLGYAAGQENTVRAGVIGTWTYQSVDTVFPDGRRVPLYGPNPSGLAMFDRDGHYLLLTARAGQPKFASDNREQGTAEENKAVVQGSIAHFGTYTVNEAEKTITFHIQTSTFPNWNGIDQTRPFNITQDELRWTTPASSGGTAEVVLRRAK